MLFVFSLSIGGKKKWLYVKDLVLGRFLGERRLVSAIQQRSFLHFHAQKNFTIKNKYRNVKT